MPNTISRIFSVTFNQDLGLMKLIESALGEGNYSNCSPHVTAEHFRLAGTGIRTINVEPVAFLDGETGEEAVKRLAKKGDYSENSGELAAFLENHPDEVVKYNCVAVLGELSQWVTRKEYGHVFTPYVKVEGAYRCFRLNLFRTKFYSVKDRILVARGEVK